MMPIDMKPKKSSTNKKRILLLALCITGIAVIGGLALYSSLVRPPAEAKETVQKPSFAFDASQASGWWAGDNNWPKIEDFTGDQVSESDLPIVQMSVAQGTPDAPGSCFVMYLYNKGPVDPAAALTEMKNRTIQGDSGLSLQEIGAPARTIGTFEGVKEYTLHQYGLTGSSGSKIARGAAFGYATLKDGYIEMRGYCETADQIVDTLPVFGAVKLL